MLHLAQNPQVQQRLRLECLSYGESLNFQNMDQLVFLDATVKEMLRMNPSIPNTVSRLCTRLPTDPADPRRQSGRRHSTSHAHQGQVGQHTNPRQDPQGPDCRIRSYTCPDDQRLDADTHPDRKPQHVRSTLGALFAHIRPDSVALGPRADGSIRPRGLAQRHDVYRRSAPVCRIQAGPHGAQDAAFRPYPIVCV